MPELWALGVERKGESTHENAGGLDLWRLLAPGCQHTHLCVLCLLLYMSSFSSALDVLHIFSSGQWGVHSGFAVHGCHSHICKSSMGTPLACFIMDLGVAVRETPYIPSCDVHFTKDVGCFLSNDVLATSLHVSFPVMCCEIPVDDSGLL